MYRRIGAVDLAIYAEMLAVAEAADLSPGPGGSRITPIGDHWGGAASLVALYPSSQIVAHRDLAVTAKRYHIPLVLNEGCWVFSLGLWQQLEIASIYHMDPTHPHGAVNWGTERRLHLMIDRTDVWPSTV